MCFSDVAKGWKGDSSSSEGRCDSDEGGRVFSGLEEDSDEGGRGLSGLEDSDEGVLSGLEEDSGEGARVLSGLEEDSDEGGRVLEEGNRDSDEGGRGLSGLEDSDEGVLSGLEDSDEGGLSGLEEDSGGGGRVLEEGDMGVSDSSKSSTSSSRILEPFLTPGKRDCLGGCPNTNSYGVVFIVPCTVVFSWSTQ